MKNLSRFLLLLLFSLVLGTGCAASRTYEVVKVADKPKSDSMYEELVVNSPLAHYMRNKSQTLKFTCYATGDFNVTPDGDKLLMETQCARTIEGQGTRLLPVEDTPIERIPDKCSYLIPFKNAVVLVLDLHGEREVTLRYRDADGHFHDVLLPPIPGDGYKFSFGQLWRKVVKPIGTERLLEVQM